jgi:acetyl-CoA carboxylase carboxyl transferase subunit alpha
MALSFLEFEQPIAELEAKIEELRFVSSDAEVNIGEEIARLRAKSRALTNSIFANLTAWQVAQLARHPQRPYTLDYAVSIFTSSRNCTVTACMRTISRSSAASRDSPAGQSC